MATQFSIRPLQEHNPTETASFEPRCYLFYRDMIARPSRRVICCRAFELPAIPAGTSPLRLKRFTQFHARTNPQAVLPTLRLLLAPYSQTTYLTVTRRVTLNLDRHYNQTLPPHLRKLITTESIDHKAWTREVTKYINGHTYSAC